MRTLPIKKRGTMTTAQSIPLLAGCLLLTAIPGYSGEVMKPTDPAIFCERTWPEDFVMQKHCIGKQQAATRKIVEEFNRLVKQEKLIEESLYHRIMGRCAQQFGDDVAMIEHCTRKQLDAYLSLKQDRP